MKNKRFHEKFFSKWKKKILDAISFRKILFLTGTTKSIKAINVSLIIDSDQILYAEDKLIEYCPKFLSVILGQI